MKGFETLKVWQRAKDLAVYLYNVTAKGAFVKDYGLRDQMRRAAVSIASNIAEGDELDSDKQSVKYFYIAKGSCAELLTQISIAREIGYIDDTTVNHIIEECKAVSGMLERLIQVRKVAQGTRRTAEGYKSVARDSLRITKPE